MFIRSFVCNTKRPSVKQSIKLQVSSNLADKPCSADGPPCTRAEMTWQMNLLLLMAPPQYQSRDDLHATTQNLADEPTLANGPPGTRAEMTWQINLLLLMTPPQYQSRDDFHATTQNLADEPTLANGPPGYQSRDALNTSTQNLADEPWKMNLLWPMDPPGTRVEMP